MAVAVAVCAEIGTEPSYQQESTLVLAPSAPGLYGDSRHSDADWPERSSGCATLVTPAWR